LHIIQIHQEIDLKLMILFHLIEILQSLVLEIIKKIGGLQHITNHINKLQLIDIVVTILKLGL
jgi:hypothetical protein